MATTIPTSGYLLPVAQAAVVLAAANIGAQDSVDEINGMTFQYQGAYFVILQTSWPYVPGTSNSPDGMHIVYQMSGSDIITAAGAAGVTPPWYQSILDDLASIGVTGVIIVGGLLLWVFLKKD